MVLNVHNTLPVRTSKARARPLVLLCVVIVMPSFMDEPINTTSRTTVGVECRPISPVSRSIGCSLPKTTPIFKSTMPLVPNEEIG
jgi:hypothetical protein